MNKFIALAVLAFSLVAFPAWSSARACGGYGDYDPETQAIESAVRTHVETREGVQVIYMERLGLVRADSTQRRVRVHYMQGTTRFVQLVRIDDRRGSWRVVGADRPSHV